MSRGRPLLSSVQLMARYLCARYGSSECPMRSTDGMLYDACPLCEDTDASRSGDEVGE